MAKEHKEMIMKQILEIAEKSYDDDFASIIEASGGKDVGDSLATFIALELQDVCIGYTSEKKALPFCVDAMDRAIRQLEEVRDALAKNLK
ncbi:MAG: hypothetical protein ACTSWQ_03980 [Candidatus Thorarchaeota archaeon]